MLLRTELWVLFAVMVCVALYVDLFVKQGKGHEHVIGIKEAAIWSCVWVAMALAFNAVIYFTMGSQKALEYLAGYLIEKSLSVDNMFVFIIIFKFFHVKPLYQPRVLKYGILGAVVMRMIIIYAGVALIQQFHWIIYVFGAFLLYTAYKLVADDHENMDPSQNPILKLFKRFMPVTHDFHEEKFFLIEKGKRYATPLFAALIVIEASDLVFAVDSIPAILAISQDTFIVYTSNIFAILGLRALYFLLSGIMDLFRFLKYGLAFILFFIGVKMLLIDVFKIPILVSLSVIAATLTISVLASLWIPEVKKSDDPS